MSQRHDAGLLRLLDANRITVISDGIAYPRQTVSILSSESGYTDTLTDISTKYLNEYNHSSTRDFLPFVILRADVGHTITIQGGSSISLNNGDNFDLTGDRQIILFFNGLVWTDLTSPVTVDLVDLPSHTHTHSEVTDLGNKFSSPPVIGNVVPNIINATNVTLTGNLTLPNTGIIKPASDGTGAIKITKADGTVLFNIDTINGRMAFTNNSPATPLYYHPSGDFVGQSIYARFGMQYNNAATAIGNNVTFPTASINPTALNTNSLGMTVLLIGGVNQAFDFLSKLGSVSTGDALTQRAASISEYGMSVSTALPVAGERFKVVATAATNTVAIFKAASGQTGDLTQWQNSGGTALASITSTGGAKLAYIIIPNNTAFYARNAANTADSAVFKYNGSNQLEVMTTLYMSNQSITGVYAISQFTASNWQINQIGGASFLDNVGIGVTFPQSTEQLKIVVSSATKVGELIQLASSATANALQINNSAGSALVAVDANGNLGFKTAAPTNRLELNFTPSIHGSMQFSVYSFIGVQYSSANFIIGHNAKVNTANSSNVIAATTSANGYTYLNFGATDLSIFSAQSAVTAGDVVGSRVFSLNGSGVSISSVVPVSGERFKVVAILATDKVAIFKGAANHSANILEIQNSSATVLAYISALGNLRSQGFRTAYVAKSADYTLTVSDYTVKFTANAIATMPTAVGIEGTVFEIKSASGVTTTINFTGGQNADGSTSLTINSLECITLKSDGANWMIV